MGRSRLLLVNLLMVAYAAAQVALGWVPAEAYLRALSWILKFLLIALPLLHLAGLSISIARQCRLRRIDPRTARRSIWLGVVLCAGIVAIVGYYVSPTAALVPSLGPLLTAAYCAFQLRPMRQTGARLKFFDSRAYRLLFLAGENQWYRPWALVIPFALCAAVAAFAATGIAAFDPDARSTIYACVWMCLCFAGLSIFQYGHWRRQVLNAPLAPAEEKPRDPVLYLRSFEHEQDVFVDVPRDAPEWKHWPHSGVCMDVYLSGALRQQVAPLIALGNPDELMPEPGASRSYVEDTAWREQVAALARSACALIAVLEISPGLAWELSWIRAQGLQRKLYLFSPPERRHIPWKTWSERYRAFVEHTLFRVPRPGRLPTPPWNELRLHFAGLGYELAPLPPAPGTILTFDGAGREVRLCEGAFTPAELVAPLRAHLESADQIVTSASSETADQAFSPAHAEEVRVRAVHPSC